MSLGLPAPLAASLDRTLGELELGACERFEPVGGGCIASAGRLLTTSGAAFLLKSSTGDLPAGLFTAEADGLRTLDATGTLRVPRVVAVRDAAAGSTNEAGPPDDCRWLLMEWLEPGNATRDTWSTAGEGLAALHRARAERFGASRDNFIGTLPQSNDWSASWPAFWRERRLLPQLERALAAGRLDSGDRRRFERLLAALDEILAPAADDGASLVHGDLWSGNLHVTASGEPALIDPSAYHGHREVDLAMADLFGGFDRGFRAAYEAAWPLAPGYAPTRRAVYQLYYLLVHVNLFGGAYRSGTLDALASAGF